MGKLYPKTEVYILELDKKFTATQTADPDIFTCEGIVLPPNTTDADIIYNVEVYTNGKPTGITTTITVYCADGDYYEPISVESDPPSTPSTGGTVTLTVRFKPQPVPPPCDCLEEGLDGGVIGVEPPEPEPGSCECLKGGLEGGTIGVVPTPDPDMCDCIKSGLDGGILK